MDRKRVRLRLLRIGVLATAAVFVAGTSPAWAASGAAASSATPAYLSAASAGEDQCTKPVAERVGNWVCYTTATGAVQPARSATVTPAATGFCNSSGCYERYDDFHADFDSYDATFGYGTKVLGSEHHYVDWQITGAQIVAKPAQMYTSISTTSLIYTGDLLNAAPGATGSSISGKYATYSAGNAAPFEVKAWLPNGYKSYDNTMWDHSQVVEFTWNVPGYSGYWYAYVKSISSHTTVLGTGAIYRFAAVTGLPASPYGGGWHS